MGYYNTLFQAPFAVVVPEMATYSIERMESRGRHVSGDPELDAATFRAPIQIAITAEEMVVMMDEGADVGLVNEPDAYTILDAIIELKDRIDYINGTSQDSPNNTERKKVSDAHRNAFDSLENAIRVYVEAPDVLNPPKLTREEEIAEMEKRVSLRRKKTMRITN